MVVKPIRWNQGPAYTSSNTAFLKVIRLGLQAACRYGEGVAVLTAGGQVEAHARGLWKPLKAESFVQVGDLTQKALKMAARMGLKKCLLAGQMGRVAKLALQKMDPQTQAGPADLLKLAALALQAGASEAGGLSLSGAGTARRAFEAALGQSWGLKFFKRLCHKAADNAFKAAGGGMKVEVWLVDYEGKVMAKASCGKQD